MSNCRKCLILVCLVAAVLAGCSRSGSDAVSREDTGAHSEEGLLLPTDKRPTIPEFVVNDFFTGQEVAFPQPLEGNRVAVYNFFSPG